MSLVGTSGPDEGKFRVDTNLLIMHGVPRLPWAPVGNSGSGPEYIWSLEPWAEWATAAETAGQ